MVGGGITDSGYGYYRMNLLSVVDPSGWSYLLPDIPQGSGDYEGFNYLGLGVILLLICAVPPALSGRLRLRARIARHPTLILLFLGLTAFALTNNVGIGSLNLNFPIPESMTEAAGVFRSSGRMFWPVFYAIVIFAIAAVVIGYSGRTATVLLAVALTLQVADSSGKWRGIRAVLMPVTSPTWRDRLVDPFWEAAAPVYAKIRFAPPQNHPKTWLAIPTYAGRYGLATDSVYLARINRDALARAVQAAETAVDSGRYDADTLYVLDESMLPRALVAVDQSRDLLARIDGLIVVAPNW
jgi:hypothetical protein